MTAIEIPTTKSPHEIAVLVEALWSGEIGSEDFIKHAHQLGASVARIEWEIGLVKQADGVA
jgi:hypothetical protein